MTWEKASLDKERVKEIVDRYNLDLLSASILVRRGVTESDEVLFYLEEDLQYAHNPFLFEEMEDAVERLLQAAEEEERVLVFGDRDVDGITSTAVMVETLRELGLEPEWKVPMGDDSYGLSMELVEEFASRDGTLIVAVDCGTTNVAEIARARELGVDTIVVDHHNPQDELPPATAIINPKVGDGGYPFQGLCACGVTSKVRSALAFARTDLFREQVCLLNLRPGNDTVIVDAIKLENLIEVDRISEALVPELGDLEHSRLADFLLGQKLLVYDAPGQERLFRQVFGSGVEIHLFDLAPEIWDAFPVLRNKTLLRMRDSSRLAKYTEGELSEVDTLAQLYRAFVMRRFPQIKEAYRSVADLVAIGTLADMMPLRNENRILVREGLRKLNVEPSPPIRTLLEKQNLLGKPISTKAIGWQIAPVINASGRMGEPETAVRLLLSRDESERRELADRVVSLNRKRKKVGEDAWRRVLPKANESFMELEERLILVHDNDVHRGVTGIIAGRLSRQFRAPAAVVTAVESGLVGSMRSVRGFGATEFLRQFEDIFIDWGGHDAAAGFNLAAENLPAFLGRIRDAAKRIRLDEAVETIQVDAELPDRYMSPDLEELIARFEPYGIENPIIRFLKRGMAVEEIEFIGKEQNHLRLLLRGGSYKWPSVYWNAAERVNRDFALGDSVDVVFELDKNHFNGQVTLQLSVVDMAREGEADER
ncbi:MAG: single-stranded-DNA-specific exonuclease RecJ [Alkalispirochaetaceae bacterium]